MYPPALEMRSRQQEVERVDTELEKRSQDIRELQTRLQDAEKKLVCGNSVHYLYTKYYMIDV